jgi:hypothetical protein
MISTITRTSPFFANYGFYPRLGIEPAQPCPSDLLGTRKREFYKANVVADRFDWILTQLKALAAQAIQRYEKDSNNTRQEASKYTEEQKVWVDTRNMKINRPMKKDDDKWDSPYTILKVYKQSCLINLPPIMKIFPVFHNSLLQAYIFAKGLPGQNKINEAESQKTRSRVLEQTDGIEEPTVK